MTKEVIVSVAGLQSDLNEEHADGEWIEVLNTGTYYKKDGKHYVFYEELEEGSSGVTKTQIRIKGNSLIEVIRKGVSNTHMIFEKNQKNRSYYDTPYGQLNLGLFTKELMLEETENSIEAEIEYSLDINCEPIADCRIKIGIKSKQLEEFEI